MSTQTPLPLTVDDFSNIFHQSENRTDLLTEEDGVTGMPAKIPVDEALNIFYTIDNFGQVKTIEIREIDMLKKFTRAGISDIPPGQSYVDVLLEL